MLLALGEELLARRRVRFGRRQREAPDREGEADDMRGRRGPGRLGRGEAGDDRVEPATGSDNFARLAPNVMGGE